MIDRESIMDRFSKHRQVILQFIKFGLVGLSNTGISLLIYYLFLYIDKDLYMAGNIVGWIVSVANSFFWNNRYVFRSQKCGIGELVRKILRTYVAYGGSFVISSILLYVEVDVFHLSAVISPLVNLVITVPLNFIVNKYWTFKEKKNGGG